MAKQAKERSDGVIKTIPKAELKKLMAEASAAKTAAAEASGEHGALVKNACERFNIERNAFSWTRKLNEMEGPKRMAVIRQMLDFGSKLGFFDQIDAFDDIVPVIEQIAKDARKAVGRAAPKKDKPEGSKPKNGGEPKSGESVEAKAATGSPLQ